METLLLLNLQPQQPPRRLLLHADHRSSHLRKSFNKSIPFSLRIDSCSVSSFSSFKTQSSLHFSSVPGAGFIQNDDKKLKTLRPDELYLVLKLPLSVLLATAVLFLSRFCLRSKLAFAEPRPLAASCPAGEAEPISGALDVNKEDDAVPIPKDETYLKDKDSNQNDAVLIQKDEGDLEDKDAAPIPEDEKALEEYLTSHPEDTEALQCLLDYKINDQHYPEVFDIISKLIKLQPEEELELRTLRGHMFINTGDFKSAETEFNLVLEEDPTQVEALYGLLTRLSQSPEWRDIRKELREIKEKIEGAIEICEIEEMEFELQELKLLRAQVSVMEGDYAASLKVYQELAEKEPDDFRPYLCQGVVYSMLQRKDDAERQLEECRKRIPEGHEYEEYFEQDVMEFVQQFIGHGGGREKSGRKTLKNRGR